MFLNNKMEKFNRLRAGKRLADKHCQPEIADYVSFYVSLCRLIFKFFKFWDMLLDAAQAPQGSGYTTIMFFVLMFVVFYFFMIRPQNKKAKKQREFVSKLEKGLRVVTLSGIHGKVDKVNEDSTLELEVSPGSYIKVEKSSISMELSMPLNEIAKDGERKK